VITVRSATEADLESAIRLWHELEDAQGPTRLYPIAPDAEDRIRASFRAGIASSDADLLVAFDGDEPVGMALVHLERPSKMSDERAVELSRVVVRSDRRGTGAGRALIDAAAGWGRQRGIRTLVAAVFVANEGSGRFWRALGFEPWVERMVRPVGDETPVGD